MYNTHEKPYNIHQYNGTELMFYFCGMLMMGSTVGLELKHELGHGLRHRKHSFIRFFFSYSSIMSSSFLHSLFSL